jgi:hypothetical protein
MTTLKSTSRRSQKDSLQELLDSAKTPEDLHAFGQLLAEEEGEDAEDADEGSRWVVKTLSEVAEFFGLSVQTVKQWSQESPPMPGQRSRWSIKEIVRWRTDIRNGRSSSPSSKKIDDDLKLVTLEQKQLDLAIQKKELIPLVDVERWAAVALIETREMVMTLPEILATSSPPDSREFIRSESDRHCRSVLTMLRRRLEADIVDSDETTDD